MTEFERQVDNLLGKGYPALCGLTRAAFREQVEPLASLVPSDGGLFALVVPVDPAAAMPLVELNGRTGFTTMDDLERFVPIEGVTVPAGPYLVTGVDTGPDTLNVTPDAAMETIVAAGRSPLTVEEGVALVTHFPEVLRERNCFSNLGSRCGDRRVTAIWVSDKRPRLGWCWAGNPHSWLGSASCAGRVGTAARTS